MPTVKNYTVGVLKETGYLPEGAIQLHPGALGEPIIQIFGTEPPALEGCQGTTKDGHACRARALRTRPYCVGHNRQMEKILEEHDKVGD